MRTFGIPPANREQADFQRPKVFSEARMKKILAVLVLLVLAAAAAIVPGEIKEAKSEHEQRMFVAVDALGRSLHTLATGDNLKIGIYSPTAEFEDDKKLWSVSGVVGVAVSSGNLGGSAPAGNELFEPFSAQLRNNCRKELNSACVRVETLTVGGAKVLDTGQAAAPVPGLSSVPMDARNRAPSPIETQAATQPAHSSSGPSSGTTSAAEPRSGVALGQPPGRPPNPAADMDRAASVRGAKVAGTPPAQQAGQAPAQAQPAPGEKTEQEAKAALAPPESRAARATPGGADLAAREPTASKPAVTPEDDEVSSAVIMQIKRGLKRLGYDPGPINSKVGPEAFSAIMAYQRRYELTLDGKPSFALLKHIGNNKSDSVY
ncbi:MAG: hypothetical protein GEU76_03115 [Alphaproteobacteria bacterium]|nr:hypothetical protein [Alphaproteobacteria bacterium]